MNDTLILQEALLSNDLIWQVHNCKLSKCSCEFDTPISLLEHYNALPDELQDTDNLNFEVLKRLNEKMTIKDVSALLGIDEKNFKKSYQIKYLGSSVIFCEPLQIAIRLQFSNTAKPAQTVFLPNQKDALLNESHNWRAFGVVDVLYKGNGTLVSISQDGNEYTILPSPSYQALPAEQSLSVLHLLNEVRHEFLYLTERICHVVMAGLDD